MRNAMLERLDPFIGAWDVQASFDSAGIPDLAGEATFRWVLGGAFLEQRSTVDHPDAPDLTALVVPVGDGYTQHYFDSRGVVRIYQMTFDGESWTLLREAADFSALDFKQRFTATFSDGGRLITGRWDICHSGQTWERDFVVTFTKRT